MNKPVSKPEEVVKPWYKHYTKAYSRCSPSGGYYKRGVRCSITASEVKGLWFRDNAYKMEKPSLDRIDNKKGYTRRNCQFIEYIEQFKKGIEERQREFSKPVLQILDGKVIKRFPSSWAAYRKTGINTGNICRAIHIGHNAGGYKWKRG